MISQALPAVLFPIIIGMIIVWFVLIKLLLRRLEQLHPAKYEAMGRPSLFFRNTPDTNFATLKFLFTRQHKTLNDQYLSRLSDAMLVFFAIYLPLFLSFFFAIIKQAPAA